MDSWGEGASAREWWDATDAVWREIFLCNLAIEANRDRAARLSSTWLTPAKRYERLTGEPFVMHTEGLPENETQRLVKVDCYGTDVENLTPLAGLQELREAYCGATSLYDLSPLRNCKKLANLCLYDTKVASLEPLRDLREIRRLCCANTRVRSLEPLARLQHLEFLSISNTLITSLAPIWGLRSLRRLRCHNTGISTEELNAFCREHPQCEVLTVESEDDDFAAPLGCPGP